MVYPWHIPDTRMWHFVSCFRVSYHLSMDICDFMFHWCHSATPASDLVSPEVSDSTRERHRYTGMLFTTLTESKTLFFFLEKTKKHHRVGQSVCKMERSGRWFRESFPQLSFASLTPSARSSFFSVKLTTGDLVESKIKERVGGLLK